MAYGLSISKETYQKIARPINYLFLGIFLYMLWNIAYRTYFVRKELLIAKGFVYDVNVKGDSVTMYYWYKVKENVFYSTHLAIKDTLNMRVNVGGDYDVIYETDNAKKSRLVIKK